MYLFTSFLVISFSDKTVVLLSFASKEKLRNFIDFKAFRYTPIIDTIMKTCCKSSPAVSRGIVKKRPVFCFSAMDAYLRSESRCDCLLIHSRR